jgi:8-amino-7-oxononanoate synthase
VSSRESRESDARVMELTAYLLEHGLFAQGIRPPTVPEGSARIRVSLSAGHSLEHLQLAARLLA